jgi:heme-degrading monooxygenase HmoA
MSDGQAVESVLFLKPVAGDHSAIRKFFEDEQILEHASRKPGFLGSKLYSPVKEGELTMVTALWASEDAYRGWVEDPWRAENAKRHAGVFEAMELTGGGGSLYEVVLSVEPGAEIRD